MITYSVSVRHYLMKSVADNFGLKYFVWVLFLVIMVLISAIIVRYISPQAAGSGVAEMKVVLRGVILKGKIFSLQNF